MSALATAGETTLEAVCELRSGFAFKSKQFTTSQDDSPMIKGSNLGHREFRWQEGPFWPHNDAENHERFWVETGDIVIAMDRPIVRDQLKFCRIPQGTPRSLLVQRVCRLRAKDGISQDTLYAIIASPAFTQYVETITTGANVPHISGPDILSYTFKWPSEDAEDALSALLTKTERIIEINTRRIALLEEAARLIFKEWFVHLRFPGHEKVKVVDGVPEGWQPCSLETLAEINPESIKKGAAPDTICYIDISCVTTGKIEPVTPMPFSEAPGRARRVVRHGDIIWSQVRPNRRSYALIQSPEPDTIASTGFAVIRATDVPYSYLYLATTQDSFVGHLVSNAQGAAYPAVKPSDFISADMVRPKAGILEAFDEIVRPMFGQIHTLSQQNIKLAEARDLLLPRLMDGRITP